MAWDRAALLARSGDASKRLQSRVDKLHALQTSVRRLRDEKLCWRFGMEES